MALENQDVFDDEEESVETTKVETEKEETETESEKGKTEPEAKAEETKEDEVVPPSKDTDKEIAGLKAAAAAERRKRQDVEAKLKKQEEVKVEIPDPVTDPEGYNAYQDNKGNARDLKLKITMSQAMSRKAHEDYEEIEEVFKTYIFDDDGNISDQSLVNRFHAADMPADFAYDFVKSKQLSDYRGSDEYETSIREDERKKLIEEIKLDPARLPDLTNASASSSNTEDLKPEDPGKVAGFDDD